MLRFLFFALPAVLVASQPTLGQAAPPCTRYATGAASDAWMAKVSRLPWKKQVAAIRARVQCDTIMQPYQPLLCYMGVAPRPNPAATTPGPLVSTQPKGVTLLYLVNGYAFYNNEAAEVERFQWLLTPKLLKKIEFIPSADPKLTALYGSRAAGGAVRLTTRQSLPAFQPR